MAACRPTPRRAHHHPRRCAPPASRAHLRAVASRRGRFGEGFARSEQTVKAAACALAGADVLALAADSTDEVALRSALDRVVEQCGVPDAVVYNAAIIQSDA